MTNSADPAADLKPPRLLHAMLITVLVISGIVRSEPAPTDLLFFLCVGILVFLPGVLAFRGFSMMAVAGVFTFLLGNGLSLMVAESPVAATRYFVITIYMFLMFAVFAAWVGRFGEASSWTLQRAFCTGALLVAGIGILARFHLLPNSEAYFLGETALRIRSTFKDPNVFAPYLVAALMLVLNDFVVKRRGLVNSIAFGLPIFLAILLAFSRGAFLHLAVSVFAYSVMLLFVLKKPDISRRLLYMISAATVFVLAAGAYALVAFNLEDFFASRMTMQSYDSERFEMQALTLEVARDYPLGIGPGEWNVDNFANDPHNTCLRVLAENGFVGLVGWLTFYASCLATSFFGVVRRTSMSATHAAAGAIMFGCFVESLVIDTVHWRHLFYIASISIGLRIVEVRRLAQGERRRSSPEALAMQEDLILVDAEGVRGLRGDVDG